VIEVVDPPGKACREVPKNKRGNPENGRPLDRFHPAAAFSFIKPQPV
jgi:hypothetical protein